MLRGVTTTRRPTRRGGRGRRSRSAPAAAAPAPAVPTEAASETPLDTFLEQPPAPPAPSPDVVEPVPTSVPEPAFAARVPPPEPERPRPSLRRGIFFDVENSSRVDHVARVLAYLEVDRINRATELVAVGNWRVINHETARMLAQRGAHLVHSAPSTGVRDWSDLRIAVAAGLHGILYPSARQSGKRCLALFPRNWADGSSVIEVSDEAPAEAKLTRIDGTTKQFT